MVRINVFAILISTLLIGCTAVPVDDKESFRDEPIVEDAGLPPPEVLRNDKLEGLKFQVEKLTKQLNDLHNKGYGLYSVSDQSWQALHMSAAAACRGSTPQGGHGPWANMVYPRTTGLTCIQVCQATTYFTECDAALSIMGYMGRITEANQMAGRYYNYSCKSQGHSGMKHEEKIEDSWINSAEAYLGYCCCRAPKDIPSGIFS